MPVISALKLKTPLRNCALSKPKTSAKTTAIITAIKPLKPA